MSTFGERFKELRKEKKMTQEKLADKFFLNKSSISRYEKNKQVPEMELLNKFANFFNVSIDYLLGRTDDRNISILENEEIPKELREIGIEYLAVLKEYKEKGFTPEDLKKLIDIMSK